MDVVGVGIAAIDVICEVETYPTEDTKVPPWRRMLHRCGASDTELTLGEPACDLGGNGTNALVVCAQLGARCRWIGVSTDPATDADAALAFRDLETFGIDCSFVNTRMQGSFPVSYILTSRQTGSRTIVHHRGMPDMSLEVFEDALSKYLASHHGDVPDVVLSVEIEALRYDWQVAKKLMATCSYVFVSKDYLREKLALQAAEPFFRRLLAGGWDEDWAANVKAVICPWGADGVYYLDMCAQSTHHIPAQRVANVVESVGAGDTFIGATVAALSARYPAVSLEFALRTACQVASAKCTQQGFKLPPGSLADWRRDLDRDVKAA